MCKGDNEQCVLVVDKKYGRIAEWRALWFFGGGDVCVCVIYEVCLEYQVLVPDSYGLSNKMDPMVTVRFDACVHVYCCI